ncbi:MAG: hypothetical protein LBU85_06005 [Treponema sp.]|jgi:hypothetical protein|nr:hypothetical protein [Treponema sp.]
MKENKKIAVILVIGLVLLSGLTCAGCESLGDFVTGFSAGYSATSDTGLTYYFFNRSSETVYFEAPGGYSGSLARGASGQQQFNSQVNMYNITYRPADKVNVSISGTSITFTDK